MNHSDRQVDLHAIEARLGARLAAGLSLQSEALPHDVLERLRVAREQALARAAQARHGAVVVTSASGGAAVLGRLSAPWWQRLASVLPLVLLVGGFLLIDRWTVREQVMAAADIDAQLLADDLPPAAYSDPGFAEYLRSVPPQ